MEFQVHLVGAKGLHDATADHVVGSNEATGLRLTGPLALLQVRPMSLQEIQEVLTRDDVEGATQAIQRLSSRHVSEEFHLMRSETRLHLLEVQNGH